MRRKRRRQAQLHLPPLDAHEALLLVAICERLISDLWRAHGDAMANVRENSLPPSPQHQTTEPPTLPLFTHDDDLLF
jgi:hypothetical protein